MPENYTTEELEQNTAPISKTTDDTYHKHHHHHSHHSSEHHSHHSRHSHHSHHHHSYDGSHRHHYSHHYHHDEKRGLLSKLGAKLRRLKRKIKRKLSLPRIANSTSASKKGRYGSIANRVFFGLIVFGVILYGGYLFMNLDSDTSLQNAQYTPSETSQLRRRVVSLEQEIEDLEKELERYKAQFGELPEEDEESTSQTK